MSEKSRKNLLWPFGAVTKMKQIIIVLGLMEIVASKTLRPNMCYVGIK